MIETNTNTNPSTNQLLTKCINKNIIAVNRHRHDYITKTSDLVECKFNYSVTKASKAIQIIYDEVVKQLVQKSLSRDCDNGSYRFAFGTKFYRRTFHDIKVKFKQDVTIDGKFKKTKGVKKKGTAIAMWTIMQDVNPLLKVQIQGNDMIGISTVLIDDDFNSVIKYITLNDGVYIVNMIEQQGSFKQITTKSTKAKKGSTKTVFINAKIDKIKINETALLYFTNTTTDEKLKSVAKQLLLVNSVKGYIPLAVSYAHSGRKYYRGSKYTNLQNANKEVRNVCFKGCTEIDINACSANYLIQQADKYGVEVKSLRQLRANSFKKKIRFDLAKHVYGVATQENIDKAKEIITAVGLGASLTVIHHGFNKLLSRGVVDVVQMKRAYRHSFMRMYCKEVTQLHKKMFNNNQDLNTKSYLHKDGDMKQPLQMGRVCTYLYQRFEAKAMNTALKGYTDNIRLQVHDGVYLDNITTKDINIIKQRFSKMDLTISITDL